jgi:hypothetical protein
VTTQQTLLLVRAFILFVLGMAASRGLVSQETVAWMGSNEALAVMGLVGAAITGGVGFWATRPKAIVASAGKILEGQGAIIAPPAIANSSVTPANVVASASAAAALPGVKQ